ncbi:MAG: hypothetical protein FWF59_01820 [Turicibacter sp.]|nr:hypothetical protein [Turicibacter sp.]
MLFSWASKALGKDVQEFHHAFIKERRLSLGYIQMKKKNNQRMLVNEALLVAWFVTLYFSDALFWEAPRINIPKEWFRGISVVLMPIIGYATFVHNKRRLLVCSVKKCFNKWFRK